VHWSPEVARRTRNKQSLQRKPGRLAPREITLIVCEGESERVYFDALRNHLRLSNAEVSFPCPQGSAPINVVDCAVKKARERGGYESIWCVFDRDEHESFDRARARLQKHKSRWHLHEAVSIPCFEYWLLLHFAFTNAPLPNCDAVIRRLVQHLPGYTKNDSRHVPPMLERLEQAMQHAERLESQRATIGDNPSTSVHHLVRHLQGIAAKDPRA